MIANSRRLMYPFFYVEAKRSGSCENGSLWAATNQCLSGSTYCVKVAEHLNQRLRDCQK